MRLKIDTHVHTVNSKDGHTPLKILPRLLKKRGLDGVAITDHDHVTVIETDEYIAIPGVEVSTSEGHLIGLGVEHPIGCGMPPEEAIHLIHRQGGVTVIAHPHDILSRNIDPHRYALEVDGVETLNASEINPFKQKMELEKIINLHGLARMGGSDSHIPQTVGDAYTVVEASSPVLDDVLEAIRQGRTRPCGKPTPLAYRALKLILNGLNVL